MDLLRQHLNRAKPSHQVDTEEIEAACRALDRAAQTPRDAAEKLQAAYDLIARAPASLAPQLTAAQLLERTRRRDDMRETWAALVDRFPTCNLAQRYLLRWIAREQDDEAARLLLNDRDPGPDATRAEILEFAELVGELRLDEHRDARFHELLARDPENIRLRVMFGKTLFARGRLSDALAVLDGLRSERLSPTARALLDKNDAAIEALSQIAPDAPTTEADPNAIMSSVLGFFATRVPRPLARDRLGGVAFYTGGMGAGGAERQLSRLAAAFHRRVKTGRRISGTWIDGPVEVIVNSLDPARGKDFNLPTLTDADVPVHVLETMPEIMPELAPENDVLAPLLGHLPRNMRFGISRLTDHFRKQAPDVVYLWQDGAVLSGVLAALLAGVPRIALSLRGLPPNLRPHLMKPAYLPLYQSLARIPGVSFSSNSQAAADAYSQWTGIARDAFSIIPNAVPPLHARPNETSEKKLAAFQDATKSAGKGAGLTIGSVFRFTPNKRGLTWVDWAARLLQSDPTLRFILIGDGEELAAAQELARARGLQDRLLFVGATNDVGFWLEQMDLFLLLSENEGLPNVLIEAQIAGVPVISTPAGGAAETFLPGQTGHLLASAIEPDYDEFADTVARLRADPEEMSKMGALASTHARRNHNPEYILAQTMRLFYGDATEDAAPDTVDQVSQQGATAANPAFDKRVQDAYRMISGSHSR